PSHIFALLFFPATATSAFYTLSLHDALPIFARPDGCEPGRSRARPRGVMDGFRGSKVAPRRGRKGPSREERRRRRGQRGGRGGQDRKSTRLNSSHLGISYAVFCLKKKKKKE